MSRTLFALVATFGISLLATGNATAEPTAKDKKLMADVSAKLLAKAKKPEAFQWPPEFRIEADRGINAFATYYIRNKDETKKYPIVIVTEDMLSKVIQSDKPDAADRLAFILGHEIGHILKGHVIADPERMKTPLLKKAFDREEEIEADLVGFELLLAAGYDFDKGMKAITRMQELKLDYSSFEGLKVGHPSWDQRAAKADKDKAVLWKAMAAFYNGTVFLSTENYELAILAFERVTATFPKEYEGWANLGYAQLMHYADKWSKDDFKAQDIGQVVIGGFYTRLDSVKVRGKEPELWRKAVGNLRKANEFKPGQTIILANLGLAYLLHPNGKDVKEANAFFVAATKAAKTDTSLEPSAHAMLLINLGIASIADGKAEAGLAQLDEGEKVVRSFSGPAARNLAPAYDSALQYTRAMVLAAKDNKADKEKAFVILETYLRDTSMLSLWWDAGYERYEAVAKAIGKEAKTKDAFKKDKPEPGRLLTGYKVKGTDIALGSEIDDVRKVFGKGETTIAVNGTAMLRVRYEKEGFELLVSGDQILAIILTGPNAPPLELKGKDLGAGKVAELKVGMSSKDMEELIGSGTPACEFTESGVPYRNYRDLGLAARVSKGKVIELVIVQIPK